MSHEEISTYNIRLHGSFVIVPNYYKVLPILISQLPAIPSSAFRLFVAYGRNGQARAREGTVPEDATILREKLKVLCSLSVLITGPLSAQCINEHRQQCKTSYSLASHQGDAGLEIIFLHD